MREVLSCRTPGQAVPLPDRFRSLKAWLLEGLAYSPELLQCLRYYLFPPRHSSFGRWGWFCLHLDDESEEAGDEKRAEYISVPIHSGEEKAKEELCLTAWFWFPGQSQGHWSVWSPWVIADLGAFVPEEPLRCEEQEDPLKREEPGH